MSFTDSETERCWFVFSCNVLCKYITEDVFSCQCILRCLIGYNIFQVCDGVHFFHISPQVLQIVYKLLHDPGVTNYAFWYHEPWIITNSQYLIIHTLVAPHFHAHVKAHHCRLCTRHMSFTSLNQRCRVDVKWYLRDVSTFRSRTPPPRRSEVA